MTAQSVTGIGNGSSAKFTSKELSKLATGPYIVAAGSASAEELGDMSPPTPYGKIVLPTPLKGGEDAYSIILTGRTAINPNVFLVEEDDNGNLTEFSFLAETEGTIYYMVVKSGFSPSI